MEIALNSDTPGGFKHENAITSQNGLALLASITLKNALNINNNNNNNNNSNNKNKKNITKKNNNNNNHLTLNQNNKNNIKHHKAPQPQHGFISSPANASSSLSSSTAAATMSSSSSTSNTSTIQTLNSPEQKNVFTFTTAGLQALTATALSTIENKTRAVVVDQQKQQQQQQQQTNNQQSQTLTTTSTAQTTVAALSSYNNNHHTSLATNHHQTNNTFSAKDPTVALLEALSIKTNKKQQNVSNQQQQMSVSSSTLATTTAIHSSVGNGGNNNSNNNNNGSGNGNSNKNNFRIPSDILDDLASRFIINVPDMELSNLIRICFQIELAHWFYLDFFCASEEEIKLQPCGIKQFALKLFEHIPFLRQHLSSIDKILEDWKNYKLSVPTYGAILISEDLNYCLLVQSYFAKSSWGFPKGKVNENEDPVHCATREVYEETGYDITELIVPNDYIEAVINYQYTRLYIVRDVSLETKFSPRTRNEIKCCDWFPIDSLPVNKTDAISKPKLGINANSFFMIMPFVKRLKKWVNDKRNGVETRRKYSGGGSPTATSPLTTTIAMNGQIKSSCKKQKRNNLNNFNDDINALNNNNGGGATTATLNNFVCGNNANANVNGSNSNSNRSKRQRHKSMGDLDGIKLNNFNNCNNQSNCKSTFNNNNNNNNNCGSITTTTASSATTPANNGGNISCNNINTTNNNNQKRYSKIVAAGSNVSNHINNNTNNGCNSNSNNNVNNGNTLSSKRQLFQSQSQTNNLQQNGEKIVSSFDLIRKEKQQMKAALSKVQKQHQNLNSNNGRQRAKSQSDKICMQHQQQQQKPTGNGNNNKHQQQHQQRLQKQQSLIVTNTNMQNYSINNNNNNNNNNHHNNINNSNKNHNNNITKSNVNNNFNNNMTTGIYKAPTPPPISGNDLLALAAATAAATSVGHTTTETATTQKGSVSGICGQQQQQPRPSSASLHFPEASSLKKETINITATGNQMPQFKRMASGTNLRILKRSTSHQPTQQNQQPQPPQRQASALQFTPSFNSWTNFTFTKNFIANVFC